MNRILDNYHRSSLFLRTSILYHKEDYLSIAVSEDDRFGFSVENKNENATRDNSHVTEKQDSVAAESQLKVPGNALSKNLIERV